MKKALMLLLIAGAAVVDSAEAKVVFRNFTVNGEVPECSESVLLWSYDADHTVEGVEFENIDPRVKVLTEKRWRGR